MNYMSFYVIAFDNFIDKSVFFCSDRDVFNEKPSREEIVAATQVIFFYRLNGPRVTQSYLSNKVTCYFCQSTSDIKYLGLGTSQPAHNVKTTSI